MASMTGSLNRALPALKAPKSGKTLAIGAGIAAAVGIGIYIKYHEVDDKIKLSYDTTVLTTEDAIQQASGCRVCNLGDSVETTRSQYGNTTLNVSPDDVVLPDDWLYALEQMRARTPDAKVYIDRTEQSYREAVADALNRGVDITTTTAYKAGQGSASVVAAFNGAKDAGYSGDFYSFTDSTCCRGVHLKSDTEQIIGGTIVTAPGSRVYDAVTDTWYAYDNGWGTTPRKASDIESRVYTNVLNEAFEPGNTEFSTVRKLESNIDKQVEKIDEYTNRRDNWASADTDMTQAEWEKFYNKHIEIESETLTMYQGKLMTAQEKLDAVLEAERALEAAHPFVPSDLTGEGQGCAATGTCPVPTGTTIQNPLAIAPPEAKWYQIGMKDAQEKMLPYLTGKMDELGNPLYDIVAFILNNPDDYSTLDKAGFSVSQISDAWLFIKNNYGDQLSAATHGPNESWTENGTIHWTTSTGQEQWKDSSGNLHYIDRHGEHVISGESADDDTEYADDTHYSDPYDNPLGMV